METPKKDIHRCLPSCDPATSCDPVILSAGAIEKLPWDVNAVFGHFLIFSSYLSISSVCLLQGCKLDYIFFGSCISLLSL